MAEKEYIVLKHDRNTGILEVIEQDGSRGIKLFSRNIIGVEYSLDYDGDAEVTLLHTGGRYAFRDIISMKSVDNVMNFIAKANSENQTGDMRSEIRIKLAY